MSADETAAPTVAVSFASTRGANHSGLNKIQTTKLTGGQRGLRLQLVQFGQRRPEGDASGGRGQRGGREGGGRGAREDDGRGGREDGDGQSGDGGGRGGRGDGDSGQWEGDGRGGRDGGESRGGGSGPDNQGQGNQEEEEGPADGDLDLTQPASTKIESLLDLIGGQVRVKYAGADKPSTLESPFVSDPEAMRDYLPALMDALTIDESPTIAGRININQAPAALLAAIPGMPPEAVESILAQREEDPTAAEAAGQQHPTWLLSEGIVDLEQMKTLLPYVCGGGNVVRAQIVGYFEEGGRRHGSRR